MPRPNKQNVDFFPHMAVHGKTIMILLNEYGNEGYAFWFQLLELLCNTEGQFYDYRNPVAWRLLLAKTHSTEGNATAILKTLAEVDAIDNNLYQSQIIWVQNLVDNLAPLFTRRSVGIPVKPGVNGQKPDLSGDIDNINGVIATETQDNVSSNPHSIGEDSIGEDSIGDKTSLKHKYGENKNVILTADEYQKLKDKFSSHVDEKINDLSYYIASKGVKYKSHYLTILSWDRKDNKVLPGAKRNDPRSLPQRYTRPEDL